MAPSTTTVTTSAAAAGGGGGGGGGTAAAAGSASSQHSLRQLVRDQITDYSRLTQSLFAALDVQVEGKVAPEAPNDIMKQIVQLDATLMGAVEKIELHQKQQQRIRQVRLEIEEQNKAIMTVIHNLRDAKQTLESCLEDQDQKRAIAADARSAEVSVTEIVAYANRLSNYTSAPPNFNPQDPNQPFEPPYPREVIMRAGILNQQHIPAAALVSLDGGFMPGTAGQPALQPSAATASEAGPHPPSGPGVSFGAGPGAAENSAMAAAAAAAAASGNANMQRIANGSHLLPQELLDDEDDDSGSSSEEEGFSLYGRIQHEEEQRRQQQQQQEQQQQQPDDEDAGDIFDLDLN